MTTEELAWVVGLFEGEGCITLAGTSVFHLRLAMTDEDVIRRLHEVTGVGRVYEKPPGRPGDKPQWLWSVCQGQQVVDLLHLMYPLLGHRRRAKAEEAFAHWSRPRRSHFMTAAAKAAVVDDWLATHASQHELARRHGISRSRVQQLISDQRKKEQ